MKIKYKINIKGVNKIINKYYLKYILGGFYII